jgi:O-antigen/teichoic acid export membrane protein
MNALKKHLSDEFFRHNAITFTTSMGAAFLSYLLHPVLARTLSFQDYGEVLALLSLYGMLAIPIGIFGSVVVNIVANTDAHDHHDAHERRRVISSLRRFTGMIVWVLVFAVLLLSPLLAKFLRFSSVTPLIVFAGTFVTGAAVTFRRAYLRGAKKFATSGYSQIIETGARLVGATAFALIGLRTVGVMSAIIIAQVCVLTYVFWKTAKSFSYDPDVRKIFTPEVRRELRFALLIAASSVVMTAITLADVLVVKHYFPPAEAGLYGGVSSIARIVVYVTGSVVTVLAPSIRMKAPRHENILALRKALLLVAALGGSVFLAFVATPSLVIRILAGRRYLPDAGLLPALSLLMLLVALLGPLMAYHLALRLWYATGVGLLGVAVILALCIWNHVSPAAVVTDFTVGVAVILALCITKPFVGLKTGPAYVGP